MIMAKYAAREWEPFGHEFAGVIEKAGDNVRHLCVGDKVVLETSTFNPLSKSSRNGRVDLDKDIINYMVPRDSMGFSEYTLAPAALCVKFDKMSFIEGSMIEPLGVAVDMVKTAEIGLNDDVLIVGIGPIGLMAVQLAKASGARKIYAAGLSKAPVRAELAKKFGADEIIYTDINDIRQYAYERGGVDKVLLTAPPAMIEPCTHTLNMGGILSFIGIAYGEGVMASFDSNLVHHRKIQIRASDAVPALYFPMCIDLVESGMVDLKSLVSHTFDLKDTVASLEAYIKNPKTAVKAVMTNE
jgi:threonine dehydrogenase-like Zn-dependent dehydrogenase